MFRLQRRWVIVTLSTVLPLLPAAFGVYLKIIGENLNPYIVLALFVGLTTINFVIAYHTHIKPFRDLSSGVRALLKIVGNRLVDQGRADGIELRLNVLLIYRPARYAWMRRFFRIRWSLGMQYETDGAATFPTKKGVCGEVVKSRRGRRVDMTSAADQSWGFTEKEKLQFPDLTVIWSLPIFELDKEDNMTGPILGTVNMDSTTPGAFAILNANPKYDEWFDELRDVVSKVTS